MTPEEEREALIRYLKVKTESADWHAVSDAANDLRVLEAQLGSPRLVTGGTRCSATTGAGLVCELALGHDGHHALLPRPHPFFG